MLNQRNPLPKEISPNPLINSVIEVRFDSDIKRDEILSIFYPTYSKRFPKIEDRRNIILEQLKKTPQFAHFSEILFKDNDYTIGLSNNVISFENNGTYHLWSNYFPIIKDGLKDLLKIGIVKSINRVGIRYASIFEDVKNINEVLNMNLSWGYNDYKEKIGSVQTEFEKDNIKLLLQISSNKQINKDTKIYKGACIDIDASFNTSLTQKIDETLFDLIDKLHTEQKTLFFSLLTDSFLNSLKPIY